MTSKYGPLNPLFRGSFCSNTMAGDIEFEPRAAGFLAAGDTLLGHTDGLV